MKTRFRPEAVQLHKAKRIIDRFINSCSHKLKSPLTSIEGLVMIADHCTDPGEMRQCLTLIHQCTLNMLDIIANLEEYTAIQNRELSMQSVVAETIVKRIAEEFEKNNVSSNVFLLSNVVQPVSWICDEESIYVILKHLVHNAFEFADQSKPTKKIYIKIDVGVDEVSIEISDNGIGIPAEEKEKIFEPFHRSSQLSKGNGLGLFVVKGVVEKLKAKILFHSAEAIGTSFQITIPNHQL
jgi:signal transduction histidine kinase